MLLEALLTEIRFKVYPSHTYRESATSDEKNTTQIWRLCHWGNNKREEKMSREAVVIDSASGKLDSVCSAVDFQFYNIFLCCQITY